MALDPTPYDSIYDGPEIDERLELAETAIQPAAFNAALGAKANTDDLGSAAFQSADSFATSTQGGKADSAVQPDELGTAAYQDASSFATPGQVATAAANAVDTAVSEANSDTAAAIVALKAESNPFPVYVLETNVSARVRAAVLTGLSLVTSTAITAADSVLSAMGKLQAQITKFVDQVNVFTKAQRGSIVALAPAANVYTPDASAGNFFSFTPAANFTLANPTNMPSAGVTQSGSFFITQDATGSRTITFGNLYKFTGGTVPVLSTAANAKDRIDYVIGPTGNIQAAITKDIK